MRGRTPRWRTLVAGGGVILALAALGAAWAWQTIFDAVLAKQLALKPGSRSYREWKEPSVPLFFEIFVFNWTNAESFPEERPNLVQLGPYSFREHRRHVNATYHRHNGSLSYRTHRTWWFDEETSNGSLDDVITTLNILAAAAVYRHRYTSWNQQLTLSAGLGLFNHQISVTKTARELLFEGYEDGLLDMAKIMPESMRMGAPLIDRMGWFYGRNNSLDTDGFMEVTTGEQGSLPGQILRWNYEDHLPYYSGKCAELRGSAGEFMPRNLTERDPLTMFIADLCRTVNMQYTRSGEIHGLTYRRYDLTERSFDNSSKSTSNSCFCNGPCLWSGVMNVSSCRFGSPAFISLPHFLHADPRLRELVTGLTPDEDKHSFYFAVEPKLGVPLDVAARFQLNFYLESNSIIRVYNNVPRMLFPIFWVQQKVGPDKSVLLELKTVRLILDYGCIVCTVIASLFLIIAALAAFCKRKTKYVPPSEITLEKPKDDAELKLNPL